MTACSMPLPASPADVPLHSERLGCWNHTEQELVLLAGWSMDSRIWRSLLPRLRQIAHITLIELPGMGRSAPGSYDLPGLLTAIEQQAPPRAIYIGWSLGGMLALALADAAPQRVQALITLATNPCFVAREEWPCAMPERDFDGFYEQVTTWGANALPRFDLLQASGGPSQRQTSRCCRQMRDTDVCHASLVEGLRLLRHLDVRSCLADLSQPAIHILGAADRLVPVTVAQQVRDLAPTQQVLIVAAGNHMLPVTGQESLLEALRTLCPRPPRAPPVQRDKNLVAQSFSAAAANYDSVAEFQRQVGEELLQRIPRAQASGAMRVLDIGCGTGYFRPALTRAFPRAQYTGLDLAEGMVVHSASQPGASSAHWLVGDAEDLPLDSASVDFIFSNLALQWCERPALLCSEMMRVLVPGGTCVFSSLGPATLCELRQAWAAVDADEHVNRFTPVAELKTALHAAGFARVQLETRTLKLQYQELRELLQELKTLGAHNVNKARPGGLTGRRRLQGLLNAYEALRVDGQLPATYEVVYVVVNKACG
ncbi:MAG: malonyl-ACP O-methyltransferase BioC [Gammaproteobacteria bacterium]|nr:malonyl-ACP O-methyltransferase BioC [Gammaproteobacteria bacterium]